MMIGRMGFLWRAKLSFNSDRRSISCFKIFSSFPKVNSLTVSLSVRAARSRRSLSNSSSDAGLFRAARPAAARMYAKASYRDMVLAQAALPSAALDCARGCDKT
jgi:hypothetical protein